MSEPPLTCVPDFAGAADGETEFTSEYLPVPREPAMRIAPRAQRRDALQDVARGMHRLFRVPLRGER